MWKDYYATGSGMTLDSCPRPLPSFHCLQYSDASDEKLGGGLGSRLHVYDPPSLMRPKAGG